MLIENSLSAKLVTHINKDLLAKQKVVQKQILSRVAAVALTAFALLDAVYHLSTSAVLRVQDHLAKKGIIAKKAERELFASKHLEQAKTFAVTSLYASVLGVFSPTRITKVFVNKIRSGKLCSQLKQAEKGSLHDVKFDLHSLFENDDFQLIEFFLNNGVSLDTLNDNGETLLHAAMRRKKLVFAEKLIQKGISLTIASRDKKETAFDLAIQQSRFQLVDQMLDKNYPPKEAFSSFLKAGDKDAVYQFIRKELIPIKEAVDMLLNSSKRNLVIRCVKEGFIAKHEAIDSAFNCYKEYCAEKLLDQTSGDEKEVFKVLLKHDRDKKAGKMIDEGSISPEDALGLLIKAGSYNVKRLLENLIDKWEDKDSLCRIFIQQGKADDIVNLLRKGIVLQGQVLAIAKDLGREELFNKIAKIRGLEYKRKLSSSVWQEDLMVVQSLLEAKVVSEDDVIGLALDLKKDDFIAKLLHSKTVRTRRIFLWAVEKKMYNEAMAMVADGSINCFHAIQNFVRYDARDFAIALLQENPEARTEVDLFWAIELDQQDLVHQMLDSKTVPAKAALEKAINQKHIALAIEILDKNPDAATLSLFVKVVTTEGMESLAAKMAENSSFLDNELEEEEKISLWQDLLKLDPTPTNENYCRIIFDHGIRPDDNQVIDFIKKGFTDIVVAAAKSGEYPLKKLWQKTVFNPKVAMAMVKGGVELNIPIFSTGETPLYTVIERKVGDELAIEMIKAGADCIIEGESPLDSALRSENLNLVRTMIDYNSDNMDSIAAIILEVAAFRQWGLVAELLDRGAPIDVVNVHGESLLMLVLKQFPLGPLTEEKRALAFRLVAMDAPLEAEGDSDIPPFQAWKLEEHDLLSAMVAKGLSSKARLGLAIYQKDVEQAIAILEAEKQHGNEKEAFEVAVKLAIKLDQLDFLNTLMEMGVSPLSVFKEAFEQEKIALAERILTEKEIPVFRALLCSLNSFTLKFSVQCSGNKQFIERLIERCESFEDRPEESVLFIILSERYAEGWVSDGDDWTSKALRYWEVCFSQKESYKKWQRMILQTMEEQSLSICPENAKEYFKYALILKDEALVNALKRLGGDDTSYFLGALETKNFDLAKEILREKGDALPLDRVLVDAVMYCKEIALELIERGVPVNYKDEEGYTPLSVAWHQGDWGLVEQLWRQGGSLDDVWENFILQGEDLLPELEEDAPRESRVMALKTSLRDLRERQEESLNEEMLTAIETSLASFA